MNQESSSQISPETKSRSKFRFVRWFLVIIAALVLLLFFIIPAYISSDSGKSMLLNKINDSIDGRVEVASLSMGWFKGFKLTEFSFADQAGRTSITAKQISTKPRYGAMITGNLVLGKTVIDEPRISINIQPSPVTDAESTIPMTSFDAASKQVKSQPVVLPLERIDLIVNNGNVKLNFDSAPAGTLEFKQINTKLALRPPGSKTSFDIALAVAGQPKDANISASGKIKPSAKKGWSLAGTSGEFTMEINDLDLASLAPLFAAFGVDVKAQGKVNADLTARLDDGRFEKLKGKIKGRDMDIAAEQLTADKFKAAAVDVDIDLQSQKDLMKIEKLDIQTDWLNLSLAGTVPKTIKSFNEFLKYDSPHSLKGDFYLDLASAMSLMPETFGRRDGLEITSGKIAGDIDTFTEQGRRIIQANAKLSELVAITDGKTTSLSEPITASGRVISEKSATRIETLGITSSFAKVECTGTTESLDYSAEVNLAMLQADLGQFINIGNYQMAGLLSSKGNMSISKEKVIAKGSSSVKNLLITSPDGLTASEAEIVGTFDILADSKKNLLFLNLLDATSSMGRIIIKDAVLPMGEEAKQPLEFDIVTRLDLQKAQPFAVMFADFPRQMQMAGQLESELSVSQSKGSYRVVTDSTSITNLQLRYPEQEPFEQDRLLISFDATINPEDKTVSVKKLQVISPQIKIKQGQLTQTKANGIVKMRGNLQAEYDLQAVSTVTAPFLPKGFKMSGQRNDSFWFTTEYPENQPDKLMANLDAEAEFGFDKAEFMGLDFGKTDLRIQIDKGLMTIVPFTTAVNEGKLNFAASADFKTEPSILKTPRPIHIMENVNINNETANLLLKYINPIFTGAVNVSGVADFNCEKLAIPLDSDNQKDLEIIGTIAVNEMRLQASDLLGQMLMIMGTSGRDVEMELLPTRFVLKDGVLSYDNMQINIDNKPVIFAGRINLNKTMEMNVTLPFTLRGRSAGDDSEQSRIVLPLMGTVDRPKINVEKMVEMQIQQEIEQQLRKGLEKLLR